MPIRAHYKDALPADRINNTSKVYDFISLGVGSGGSGAARRAASYGAKCLLIDKYGVSGYGGTCVNVGCVPKKIMSNVSHVWETVTHEASHFGVDTKGVKAEFDWNALKTKRDAYIKRLNGIYANNYVKDDIDHIAGHARLAAPGSSGYASGRSSEGGIQVAIEKPDGTVETVIGKNVMIATGGRPRDGGFPGSEHCIDSDGFFELEQQPKKTVVLGAGYIAVEMAGIMNALGTETYLCVRNGTSFVFVFFPYFRKFGRPGRHRPLSPAVGRVCVVGWAS